MDRPLVIIGAGGHACVLAEAAISSGWAIAGHIAPQAGSDPLLGVWLGTDDAITSDMVCALGLGFVDRAGAQRRAALLDHAKATVLHPAAIIANSAQIDQGAFAAAGAMISTQAHIGAGALINTGAIVDHHCRVGTNTHIATGARLTGNVTIGNNVLVGAGAIIRQGVSIGHDCIVGAGAVVLDDMPDKTTWVGNPAGLRI